MRILVVEDEFKTAQFIKKGLSEVGYSVDVVGSANDANSYMASSEYDLVILDVMLPDRSGFETAQTFRKDGYTGSILMLTALSTTNDKVTGLDAGADDYLTKPFAFDELLARIRANFRRKSPLQTSNNILKYADLEMNLVERKVFRSKKEIELTTKEFALLEFFLRNPERPLGRVSIAEHVWDINFDSESNVIDVYINLLRKKIDQPFDRKLIQTIVGVGYVLK